MRCLPLLHARQSLALASQLAQARSSQTKQQAGRWRRGGTASSAMPILEIASWKAKVVTAITIIANRSAMLGSFSQLRAALPFAALGAEAEWAEPQACPLLAWWSMLGCLPGLFSLSEIDRRSKQARGCWPSMQEKPWPSLRSRCLLGAQPVNKGHLAAQPAW